MSENLYHKADSSFLLEKNDSFSLKSRIVHFENSYSICKI